MTLPALDSWAVRGIYGPDYKVGPTCANPGCEHFADHAHHIVRRSQLGGDYKWVELEDGSVVANLAGLCADCHDMITGRVGGHRAAIRLFMKTTYGGPQFFWCGISESNGEIEYLPLAPLSPQPPSLDSLAQRASTEEDSESCPFCGQVTRRRRSESAADRAPRRRRKSWAIDVPDDDEDGAEILDVLVAELAPLLGVQPAENGRYSKAARYFVVLPALYYAQQGMPAFVRAIKGEG